MRNQNSNNLSLIPVIMSILVLFISFLTVSCGEKDIPYDSELDKLLNEEVVPIPENYEQADLEEIYEVDSEEIKLLNEAQEILDAREVHQDKLKEAIGKLNALIELLPARTPDECKEELKLDPHDQTLTCNKISNALAKKSEIYWHLGELSNDPAVKYQQYKNGRVAGWSALTLNKNNAEASHWNASNLGSEFDHNPAYSDCKKKKNNWEVIKATLKTLEGNYLRTIAIDTKFRKGEAHAALGRFYQEFYRSKNDCNTNVLENWWAGDDGDPNRWIPNANPAKIEAELLLSIEMNPDNYYPHEYLFEFYRDQKNRKKTQEQASWLRENATNEEFATKLPITTARHLRLISGY